MSLAPDPLRLSNALRRADIKRAGDLTNADLIAELHGHAQALVIVNSRKHAYELYQDAVAARLEGVVHLTTRQCAAHRRLILDDVRQRLKGGCPPCRVIATSLIEAGVDVPKPGSIRSSRRRGDAIVRDGANEATASSPCSRHRITERQPR